MALDPLFWPALWRLAIAADTRPELLLTVWFAESGLDPSAQNSLGCIGLNQTCPSSIGGPGFPGAPEGYRAAPASQQVAWIAPQVLAQARLNGGGFRSAARAYQANFLPATLTSAVAPDDVIAAEAGPYAAAYRANKLFDVSGDGRITLADLGDYLEQLVVSRGLDVDLGAPLETAIAAAYAPQNLPPNAPWTTPDLVLHEGQQLPPVGIPVGFPPPPVPPANRTSGGAVAAVTVIGLLGVLAIASRHS
jgi:hypothetical protein